MLKSCTELHLSFSSFMNHRRHFLAQLSSELSPHLQNSRAFRSIKWRRTKRGISVNREGNVYFPFPLPPGERWIQWFRIYGITGSRGVVGTIPENLLLWKTTDHWQAFSPPYKLDSRFSECCSAKETGKSGSLFCCIQCQAFLHVALFNGDGNDLRESTEEKEHRLPATSVFLWPLLDFYDDGFQVSVRWGCRWWSV